MTSLFKACYLATAMKHSDKKMATKMVTSVDEDDTAVQDAVRQLDRYVTRLTTKHHLFSDKSAKYEHHIRLDYQA